MYYKIRVKSVYGKYGWADDHNTPDPKKKSRTKRYKNLTDAKKAFGKVTWGVPHRKKIVEVTPRGTKTVHTSTKVFSLKKKR